MQEYPIVTEGLTTKEAQKVANEKLIELLTEAAVTNPRIQKALSKRKRNH